MAKLWHGIQMKGLYALASAGINMFTKADLKIVGFDNFTRLFAHPDF
jgi:hypothetical protein